MPVDLPASEPGSFPEQYRTRQQSYLLPTNVADATSDVKKIPVAILLQTAEAT